jgi:hypothetical protein
VAPARQLLLQEIGDVRPFVAAKSDAQYELRSDKKG